MSFESLPPKLLYDIFDRVRLPVTEQKYYPGSTLIDIAVSSRHFKQTALSILYRDIEVADCARMLVPLANRLMQDVRLANSVRTLACGTNRVRWHFSDNFKDDDEPWEMPDNWNELCGWWCVRAGFDIETTKEWLAKLEDRADDCIFAVIARSCPNLVYLRFPPRLGTFRFEDCIIFPLHHWPWKSLDTVHLGWEDLNELEMWRNGDEEGDEKCYPLRQLHAALSSVASLGCLEYDSININRIEALQNVSEGTMRLSSLELRRPVEGSKEPLSYDTANQILTACSALEKFRIDLGNRPSPQMCENTPQLFGNLQRHKQSLRILEIIYDGFFDERFDPETSDHDSEWSLPSLDQTLDLSKFIQLRTINVPLAFLLGGRSYCTHAYQSYVPAIDITSQPRLRQMFENLFVKKMPTSLQVLRVFVDDIPWFRRGLACGIIRLLAQHKDHFMQLRRIEICTTSNSDGRKADDFQALTNSPELQGAQEAGVVFELHFSAGLMEYEYISNGDVPQEHNFR